MIINTARHGQSIESINEYGLKHWSKNELSGTLEIGDDPIDCLLKLKKYIDIQVKSMCNNFNIISESKSFINDEEIDLEFEQVKKKLNDFEYKEDAQSYLDTTNFKYTIEVKKIVNSKPNKAK